MPKKVDISLTPLHDATWFTDEDTGARFKVAPMDPETEEQFNRESMDDQGRFNVIAFYGRVVQRFLKDWEGFTDQGNPSPCNEENRRLLMKHNAMRFGPFIAKSARSLDHFRAAEVAEGKKD